MATLTVTFPIRERPPGTLDASPAWRAFIRQHLSDVAAAVGIPVEALLSLRRGPWKVCRAREIAALYLHRFAGLSLSEVAAVFGRSHHTTAFAWVRNARSMLWRQTEADMDAPSASVDAIADAASEPAVEALP